MTDLEKFDEMFGSSEEENTQESKVNTPDLSKFDEIEKNPDYQSAAYKVADMLTNHPANKAYASAVARYTPSDQRDAVIDAVAELGHRKKAVSSQGVVAKSLDAFYAGLMNLGETGFRTVGLSGPVGLAKDEEQEKFARRLETAWSKADPLHNPEASWYNPAEALVSASEMVPQMYVAGAAGKAAGFSAEALGAGSKMVGLAEGAGAAASFAPGMYEETYDTLLDKGVAPSTARWAAATSAGLQSTIFATLPAQLLPKGWGGKVLADKLATSIAAKYAFTAGVHGPTVMAGTKAIDEAIQDVASGESKEVKEYLSNAWDTYKKSIGPMAVMAAPNAISSIGAKSAVKATEPTNKEKFEQEILDAADNNVVPSRGQWKKWKAELGLGGGRTEGQRLTGVKAAAEEIRNRNTQETAIPEEQPEAQEISENIVEQDKLPQTQSTQSAQPPVTGSAPDITSIKKDAVNDLRAKRGEEPLTGKERGSFEEWNAEAEKRIKNDPLYADKLIEELKDTDRPFSEVETAAMQRQYRGLQNSLTSANEKLIEVAKTGDSEAITKAQAEADNALKAVQNAEEAGMEYKSRAGGSLVSIKMELKEDFSLGRLVTEASIAKGGKPLTPEESTKVKEISDKVAELEKKLESIQANKETTAEVTEATTKKGFKKPSARKIVAKKNIESAWEEFHSVRKAFKESSTGETGALNVDLLAASGKLVKAYVDYGVVSFSEFMAHVKTKLGEDAEKDRDTLLAAWNEAKERGEIPDIGSALSGKNAIGGFAKKLERSFVEAGIKDRENVVDAVHEVLKEYDPKITRREAMDAISGYGQLKKLPTDQISAEIRDINGQLQQLAKLEDMQKGSAPKKTGMERRIPSDEERQLIQQVNEAKKRGGYKVTDPATQLKSALDAAKTAVKNRIADLEKEIETREKIVKNRTDLKPDEELIKLRKRRDELLVEHKEAFPITEEQRIERTSKSLDRAIEQLEDDLKAGKIGFKKKAEPVSSPEIEVKRKRLEELRDARDKARESSGLTQQRENEIYKKSLEKRLEELRRKVKEKDFSEPVKEEKEYSDDILDVQFQIQEEKLKYQHLKEEFRRSQFTPGQAAAYYATGGIKTARAIMTSFDDSALLRQGGWIAAAHPLMAAKTIPEAAKAAMSKKGEYEILQSILNRPNAKWYKKTKLPITQSEGSLNSQEEAYQGAFRIPGVAASERAYIATLNLERADLFDVLAANLVKGGWLQKPGEMTLKEANAISNYVAAASGRGNLGKLSSAADGLATTFFSPRFLWSRVQLLTGQPMWGGTARTRVLIAKDYARVLIGLGVFYSSIAMAAKMFKKGDVTIEEDPRSPNFGKVQVGDTKIDPLFGLSQVSSFITQSLLGEKKISTGEIRPIRKKWTLSGKERRTGDPTWLDLAASFLRSKSSPMAGTVVDVLQGENFKGEETTLVNLARRNLLPMPLNDIYDNLKETGVPAATALSLLGFFGMNSSTYKSSEPSKFAYKIAQHEQLSGVNKKTKKKYDHTQDIREIVAQANKLGISESDLMKGLEKEMKSRGYRNDTISEWKVRLQKRYKSFHK